MNETNPNARLRTRFGIKTILVVTTVVGIVLHLGMSTFEQSYEMLGVNLLLFYAGAGIALSITSIAIMTLGNRASIVGAFVGAAAWASLLWTVHLFEPSIQPYIPRHIAVFAFISLWLMSVSARPRENDETT